MSAKHVIHTNVNEIKKFHRWLKKHGSDTLPTHTKWEVCRFGCRKGIGSIYVNAKGRHSISAPWVLDALNHCRKSAPWQHHGPTEKPVSDKQDRPQHNQRNDLKKKLRKRDGAECWFCAIDELEIEGELTLEHFISIAEGGLNRMSNLCLACEPCNDEASTMAIVDKVKLRESKRS